jgi:cytidylate kinase
MSSSETRPKDPAEAARLRGGRPNPATPAAVVTLAALYGVGGSLIGPRVAERLGVAFLDRAIPASVAERAGVTEEAVDAVGERRQAGIDRLTATLARVVNATTATGESVERVDFEERRLRAEIEEFLARASRSGGVVLGRGGAVVLRDVPGALHVYLGGSREDRVERAMELEDIDRETAERRLKANDRARRSYVRDAYGVDGDDPSLYHLMLDATAYGLEGCIDLIVSASHARRRTHAATA